MRVFLLLTLTLASPASAQGLRNFNANTPVDVDADRVEAQDRSDRAIFSGNVRIRQGSLALDAARVTLAYTGAVLAGNPSIQRVDASGGVFVRNGGDSARGSFATYDLNRRIITMIGGVSLNQGGNVLRGGRLVIDLQSGRSVLDGRGGGDAPGTIGNSGGRVSGRFSVPQRATP